MSLKKHHLASLLVLVAALVAAIPVISRPQPTQAASGTQLYLSPASQTVTTGSNLVVSIVINPGGASVNTVQSVFTYSAAHYDLVSIAPGAAFGSFPNTPSSGQVQFSAASTSAVTGTQPVTVATVTLQATGVGTSAMGLAGVCPAMDYALTCSAAYDSVTSDNDLASASGGSYSVAAAATPPANTSSSSTGSTAKTGSSSSGTKSSGSSSTSSPSTTATTATPTPTTTATNPAPVITGVKVSGITATSATVTWQTNLPASSVVEYGLNTKYGLTAQSSGLVTAHKVTLTAPYITQGTTYYLEVLSATAAGASSTGGAQRFTAGGFTVTIRVVDTHGRAIKGARVASDGQAATTNASGTASLHNLPAGPQKVVIKSGGTSTDRTITVGKLDPKTNSYQPQQFSLTAARGSSPAPYIVAALIILAIAGLVVYPPTFGWLRRTLSWIGGGKGPGGRGPTGGPSGMGPGGVGPTSGSDGKEVAASPSAPSNPPATPSAPDPLRPMPGQIIHPGTPAAEAAPDETGI